MYSRVKQKQSEDEDTAFKRPIHWLHDRTNGQGPCASALQHTKKIINFISFMTAGDIIYLIQRGL